MSGNPHEIIIKRLCKEILLPHGVFQKGASRIYIDDNGYFLTVIEFQPSGWAKGTYINLALNFLWEQRDYITFDFPPDTRIMNLVQYESDEQFEREIRPHIEAALEQILFYRTLRDIPTAEEYFDKYACKYKSSEDMKKLSNIHGLERNELRQVVKQQRTYWRSQASMKKLAHSDIYDD